MQESCGFEPWVRKIPWRRTWQHTPVFLPGESYGQRSLVGFRLWGRTVLDTLTGEWTRDSRQAHTGGTGMTARRQRTDWSGRCPPQRRRTSRTLKRRCAVTENSVEGPPRGPAIPLLGTQPKGMSSLLPADGRTPCLLWRCSQVPRHGDHLSAH